MRLSFLIFICQTGVVLSLIAAMSFTGPLMTTLNCFSKGGTEIVIPNNLDKEIEDIRDLYSRIEKDKSTYRVLQMFQRERDESVFLVEKDNEDIVMDEYFSGAVFFDYKQERYLSFPDEEILFYFNSKGFLKYVKQSSWDPIEGSYGDTVLYYFSDNARHPFFIYQYGNYYQRNYDEATMRPTDINHLYENRLYMLIESTVNSQDCPKVIKALTKFRKGESLTKIEDLQQIPNRPMDNDKRHKILKLLFAKNLVSLSQTNILDLY
jgi:hypothetical protein